MCVFEDCVFENSKTKTSKTQTLQTKTFENTDVSQIQKQPLLVSVMNLSPLVCLFFFFSRSAFSRSVVCVFKVCVFETPLGSSTPCHFAKEAPSYKTNCRLIVEVLASLFARIWIPGAREEIRECERACMVCRRLKVQPVSQIMAPLPAVRAQMSLRAFSNISVDFAGLFLTKQGRGKTKFKRYLCLFASMNTLGNGIWITYKLFSQCILQDDCTQRISHSGDI